MAQRSAGDGIASSLLSGAYTEHRPLLQQDLDHVRQAVERCPVQRRDFIAGRLSHVLTVLKTLLQCCEIALLGGPEQETDRKARVLCATGALPELPAASPAPPPAHTKVGRGSGRIRHLMAASTCVGSRMLPVACRVWPFARHMQCTFVTRAAP
jgi:hypothetical protein